MELLTTFLISLLRLSVPVLLAAFGNMYCERAGIMNLGAEGMMIAGAFGAVLGAYYSNNPWIGVLCGVLLGMFIASIHSLISVEFGGIQNISGLGLNTLAAGIAAFFCQSIFGSSLSESVPSIQTTELLGGIPVLGPFLRQFSPLLYLTIAVVILSWFVMKKTVLGTHIIAVGDDPKAAETAGIQVWKLRHLCVSVFCGGLVGLAGAYLSIGQLSFFMENMTNGKGMLAVIAVKMGGWEPVRIVAVALFFGFFDALQTQLQLNNALGIAPELIRLLPYLAGLVALAFTANSDANPKALRQPYLKNKYKF